jgi:mRNA interferase HigB
MRVLGRKRLAEFLDKHADARDWISAWLKDIEGNEWPTPHDFRKRYSSVSFLGDGKVVFNVKGHRYRLVGIVAYQTQVLIVDWLGTHAEYDDKRFR